MKDFEKLKFIEDLRPEYNVSLYMSTCITIHEYNVTRITDNA